MNSQLKFSAEVKTALADRSPIVALESTIISHGMPFPQNVEMANEVEAIIRENGATPATIAVLNGQICVGLEPEQLELLATAENVGKLSTRDVAHCSALGNHGATTVAATMAIAHAANISLFVTGGIGGVHRGAPTSFDISADLGELAKTKVCVISAGVKSILDIGLTLECLETYGVPVITYASDVFPSFYSRHSNFESPMRADSAVEIANIMKAHWGLGVSSGISIANPIPASDEITAQEISSIIDSALMEMNRLAITGKKTTPYLLAKIAEMTNGASLTANIALVKNNAVLGAQIAVAYAKL